MLYQIHHTEPQAQTVVSQILTERLRSFPASRKVACICIGTDRSTGDSLGPLVGSILAKENINSNLLVYGTLDKPVHALNLQSTLTSIRQSEPDAIHIAVDACLGKLKNIGTIQIGEGPIHPGAGVNKKLPEVGDMHITGIVNISGFMEYMVLQNTRLGLVMRMAETIASSILQPFQKIDPMKKHTSIKLSL